MLRDTCCAYFTRLDWLAVLAALVDLSLQGAWAYSGGRIFFTPSSPWSSSMS
jgi:hypothetical protein